MTITPLQQPFSILKIEALKPEYLNMPFFMTAVTDEEVSLVCPTEHAPQDFLACDEGWRAFRLKGTFEFSLVGVLSKILTLLGDKGISIFAISTYQTDYVFTKEKDFAPALDTLKQNGYIIQ